MPNLHKCKADKLSKSVSSMGAKNYVSKKKVSLLLKHFFIQISISDGKPVDGQVIQHYQTNTLPPKWKGKHKIKKTTFTSLVKKRRVLPTPGPETTCVPGSEPISKNCPPLPALKKKYENSVHQPSLANGSSLKKMIRFMRIKIQRLRREKQHHKQHRK